MINIVFSKITDDVSYKENGKTSYLNVYNYKLLRKSPDIYRSIDRFTLDGILLILFIRLFYGKKINRKAPDFSSYFKEFYKFLSEHQKRVYFVGAKEDEIIKFLKIVRKNYPELNVVGYQNGYDINEAELISELISKEIEVLIIGLGTPKQELFITKLHNEGYEGVSYACGAFISQTANRGHDYFPSAINALHLRWAYRIYKEPKLFSRYFLEYPKGLLYLTYDRFFKFK